MINIKAVITRIAVPLAGAAVLAVSFGAGPASARPGVPFIGPGSQGTGVRCVQEIINLEDPGTNLAVDGIDGAQTTNAVKLYQRQFGFTVDGVVGPQTGTQLLTFDSDPFGCYNFVPSYH